jgi:PAS domain S-box-containing protein
VNVYLNRHWVDCTGRTVEEGLGTGWFESVHPDDREAMMARWTRSLCSGEFYQTEYRLRERDGTYRWHVVRGVPVQDEAGRVVRWYGSSTDIDEPKRLAEALRAADRRKDEFLAMLAHELRNPLAPIRNAASVMAIARDDEAAMRWAREVVDRQTRQLARLVDDLLDVSRITQGKVTLNRSPLMVSSIVHAAVEGVRPLVEARRHALEVRMPDDSLRVDGAPTRLAQVLLNLLNNAAKYTPEGGHLAVDVDREGDACRIRVTDDGEGMDAELLPTVFELFTQGSRSMDRSQGGLGVGLTLVKRLVELHGGTVEAASPGPGLGSSFTLRLPLLPGPVAAGEDPGNGWRATGGGSRRVLVVDDNRDAAQSMAMLLRELGHAVDLAHDGPGAIDAALRNPPDLVFLDIGLPGMDGYEVARRLRAEPALEGVRLVAVTGYGGAADRRSSAEAGIDEHLVKPVELEDVIDVLARRPVGGR